MTDFGEANAHVNQLILELDNNHGITITKKEISYVPQNESVHVHLYFTYDKEDMRWDYSIDISGPIHHEKLETDFMLHLSEYLKETGRGMEEIQ